jgi:hypothetical protein
MNAERYEGFTLARERRYGKTLVEVYKRTFMEVTRPSRI